MTRKEEEAIDEGKRQAESVMALREAQRARRAEAMERRPLQPKPTRVPRVEPQMTGAMRARIGPPGTEWLIAEGDSWFDYPLHDVLKELQDLGWEVESVSHKGDTIEGMAYGSGQLDDFVRALEKLIRNGMTPEAILLSGGGNDVAGDEFAFLLNHAISPTPGLNAQVMAGVIDDRIYHAYITVLTRLTEVCQMDLGVALPILVHGYDYAVPDGRGFWSGLGPLPGPWLQPSLFRKGYPQLAQGLAIVRQLIDGLNEMLARLPDVPGLGHVHHVDLRNTLSTDPADYQDLWANELHPSGDGFGAVAEKFAALLPA